MKQPSKTSIRTLFWKEALPAGCFVSVLSMIPNYLTHYQWFAATGIIYIWTIIWFTACLLSLRVLVVQGPLMVVSYGMCQTFPMMWDLYGSVADRGSGMESTMREMIGAGFFNTITSIVGYYCATRMNIPSSRAI
jgi:hypothetical protein